MLEREKAKNPAAPPPCQNLKLALLQSAMKLCQSACTIVPRRTLHFKTSHLVLVMFVLALHYKCITTHGALKKFWIVFTKAYILFRKVLLFYYTFPCYTCKPEHNIWAFFFFSNSIHTQTSDFLFSNQRWQTRDVFYVCIYLLFFFFLFIKDNLCTHRCYIPLKNPVRCWHLPEYEQ